MLGYARDRQSWVVGATTHASCIVLPFLLCKLMRMYCFHSDYNVTPYSWNLPPSFAKPATP
jgi:hypothetical protein